MMSLMAPTKPNLTIINASHSNCQPEQDPHTGHHLIMPWGYREPILKRPNIEPKKYQIIF